MNLWELPQSCEIGGEEYAFNADFRNILRINGCFSDASRHEYLRWKIAMRLFYGCDVPYAYQEQAMEYMLEFIDYGVPDGRPTLKLIDWGQDAQMIIADINKVAGHEVRSDKFLHWWTFLGYFYGIGEGQLSSIVSIRAKRQKGKKLEKWEQDYYKENRKKIDFQTPDTPEKKATKAYFDKWL